jgi:hypothetical protein
MTDSWDSSVSVEASNLPQSERRRSSPIETATLAHVLLSCLGAALSTDPEEQHQHLAPATGVVVGALISVSIWATLIGAMLLWIA